MILGKNNIKRTEVLYKMPNDLNWKEIYTYIATCAYKNNITSAHKLAELSDVDESQISKLKKGDYKNPSFATIYGLCKASGASLDVLCGLKEEQIDISQNEIDEILKDVYKKQAEEIQQLNKEFGAEKLKYQQQIDLLTAHLAQSQMSIEHIRNVARFRLRYMISLAIFLLIALSAVIILALCYPK